MFKHLFTLVALVAILSAASGLPAGAMDQPSLAGYADEGTYRFYLNEEVLVTQEFMWDAAGSYKGSYTLSMAGQTVSTTMRIDPGADGVWSRIEMETPQGLVTVVREDSVARTTHGQETTTTRLRDGTLLFENFNPPLMNAVVRAYDAAAGGKQTVPLFIVPAIVLDATIERLDSVERSIAGKDLKLDRYQFGIPGVDLFLFVDDQGRVVFGDVPSQHGAYVRDGYEAMMKPEEVDPLLSRPEYEVDIQSNVQIPMRDGVKLATDLYRPRADGKHPVILVRTPYKKEMNELQGRFYARRGYVYAVQDVRGRFSSPGTWEPFVNESNDGFDTIQWLGTQSWSSGRVGMIGASYLGWVQWWAAKDRPQYLKAIIPNVSPPDPYFNIPYEYGCFFLLGAIWWADILESEATGDLSGKAMQEIGKKKYARILRELPVVDLDKKVLGKKNPYWRTWIDHPTNDEYWERASFLDNMGSLDIPVFHQSGWFDGDGIGSKLNYLRMRSHGHPNQKLVLGPWGHTDVATRRIGDRDFGPAATIDLQRDYLRWLDRWLKGIGNGIEQEPLVKIFVMGSNRWLEGNTYPLAETQMTKLYITSGGNANTSAGDGRLSFALPPMGTPPDRFVYDPGDPTPSPNMPVDPDEMDPSKDDQPTERSIEELRGLNRAYHAKVNAERTDILVYDTEPLTEPLTIAGPISAVLYASSSAKDTDWFVRLSEVAADGAIFQLVEGKVRARYRESFREPLPLEPGKVYEYALDLWQTGITVPAGAKLRVEVASASFPMFSRNLNTGGHSEKEKRFVTAEQMIYHDAEHPSHLLLPVIPSMP